MVSWYNIYPLLFCLSMNVENFSLKSWNLSSQEGLEKSLQISTYCRVQGFRISKYGMNRNLSPYIAAFKTNNLAQRLYFYFILKRSTLFLCECRSNSIKVHLQRRRQGYLAHLTTLKNFLSGITLILKCNIIPNADFRSFSLKISLIYIFFFFA